MTDEVSFSNHRHIQFEITGIRPKEKIYNNPCGTNWEKYYYLGPRKWVEAYANKHINDRQDIEIAVT